MLNTATSFATQADVQNLSSGKYFENTLSEINSAKVSIFAVMYLISSLPDQPDSQPNQLLNTLIKAKDRGVDVKVILDQKCATNTAWMKAFMLMGATQEMRAGPSKATYRSSLQTALRCVG